MHDTRSRAVIGVLAVGVAVSSCSDGKTHGSSNASAGRTPSVPSSTVATKPITKFDQDGGPECRMTWGPDGHGGTEVRFVFTVRGELIMHVSGPGSDQGRHDVQVAATDTPTFDYSFRPEQVGDLGAVLYRPGGGDPYAGGCSIHYARLVA